MSLFTVRLTPNEVFAAAHHALMRRWGFFVGAAHERNPANDHLRDVFDWDNDINSCCAEMSFSKWRDIYWRGLGDVRFQDTTWGEVRWTRLKDRGGLIIRLTDELNRRYALLDGTAPEYTVVGWLWGREGKQRRFWDSKANYYLIPRENLHRFDAESLTLPCSDTEPTESQPPAEPRSEGTADSSATTNEQSRGASLDQ